MGEPGTATRRLKQRRRQRERHKFAYLVGKTIALHALHVRCSRLSISLPSSAKQQREIAKFEVLRRTLALEDKFSFSPPSVIFEELSRPCHIKRVETVKK